MATHKTVSKDTKKFRPHYIDSLLDEMGMLHGLAAQPNGWPETEDGWLSNEYLDRRLRFATYFSGDTLGYKSAVINSINEFGLKESQLDRFNLSNTSMNFLQNNVANSVVVAALLCSPEFLRT